MRHRPKILLRPDSVQRKVRTEKASSRSSGWLDQLLPTGIGKNTTAENTVNRTPIVLIGILCAITFMILSMQLLNLQLAEGERMRGIAEGNRVREQVTYAPRGKILDRNGIVLADNTASYQLSVSPYLLPDSPAEREEIFGLAAGRLPETTTAEIAADIEEEGQDSSEQVLVAEGLSHQVALQLEYILPDLPGFHVDSIPVREYKSEAAMAHILGYVGRISPEDLEQNPELYPIDFIGKRGIEQQYDEILRGRNGVIETEVDASGRPLSTIREVPTEPGQDIQLTLDYELQREFAKALSEEVGSREVESGSGVILDASSGAVRAMVSLPSYDNNLFQAGITPEVYEDLANDSRQPMLNRAVSGSYPTGSVIKPFNLIGALENDVVDENTIIVDRGSISVGDFTFRGWESIAQGPVNARSALARSSNIYFYTVAGGYEGFEGMGIEELVRHYEMFGLGKRTGIDLPNETTGLIPNPEWKEELTGESWYIGDTYNLAIGQGDMQASPLQMARGYAAIVNSGSLVRPHLFSGSEDTTIRQLEVGKANYQIVKAGMRDVVSGSGTTSPAVFADVNVPVAGKSGTAETDPDRREPHAWYVAYAPYGDNPELVSSVILESGGGGSDHAAPVIAEAFAWYFRDL